MSFHGSRHSLDRRCCCAYTISHNALELAPPSQSFRFARNCTWGKLLLFLMIKRLCHQYHFISQLVIFMFLLHAGGTPGRPARCLEHLQQGAPAIPLQEALGSKTMCSQVAFRCLCELQPHTWRGCAGEEGGLWQGHGKRLSASHSTAHVQSTAFSWPQHGHKGRNSLSEGLVNSQVSRRLSWREGRGAGTWATCQRLICPIWRN